MSARSSFRPGLLLAWVAVAAVLFAMPALQRTFGFAVYNLIFLYFVFFWVTQATSWNIFCGYSGYFSFGQGAFYGAGLYTTAILVTRHDFSLLPALPVGGLVAGLIALASGVLVFRLRKLTGEIFALFTLAVALGLGSLANNWSAIDGGRGIPVGRIPYPEFLGSVTEMLYYLGLALALAAVFIAYAVQHSRFGTGLFAIRDDERVAASLGVPALRYKLVIFTLNGVIAGVSAALHAVQVNFVSPGTAFGIRVPLFVILMSVVGGRRHWMGPVLGAVLIYTVNDRLTGAGHAELARILLAVVLIVATLLLREGIVARLRQRPLPALVVGAPVLVAQLLLTDASVITAFAFAMIAALLALFLPERLFDRLPLRRRPAGPEPREAEAGAGDGETPRKEADERVGDPPLP